MKLLIVNLHLEIGGVETLLARLIPLLQKQGVEVTLLLLQNKVNQELLDAVTPFCRVLHLKDAFPYTRGHLRKFFGQEFDVVFYTIARALLVGSWLLGRADYRSTKTVLGAYQTEIFCQEEKQNYYHQKLVRQLVSQVIPPSSIIFGNTAGRDHHAAKLGIDLRESPVIRLFVDVEKYTFKDRSSLPRKKIVSIGRITDFKTYNFTMLPVIKSLVAKGHDVEWHVYGDGEQFDEFKQAVADLGLQERVFAHGLLKYSQFEQVLEDAFLFVGSGTSLIEAAACGVPSLTTIEYAKEADSYGFICDIEGYNLIEPGLDKKVYKLEEKIEELIKSKTAGYSKIQLNCANKALLYSGKSVIKEYIDTLNYAKNNGKNTEITTKDIILSIASFAKMKVYRILFYSR